MSQGRVPSELMLLAKAKDLGEKGESYSRYLQFLQHPLFLKIALSIRFRGGNPQLIEKVPFPNLGAYGSRVQISLAC